MTTHELLELASLDALGLLDPQERESFESAFRAAPPSIQAQIRREQTRLARMDDLLPDVEPPLGLRARVLAAVREAVRAVSGGRSHIAGSIIPALRPVQGVNRFWRAGAIGCAAATVVFGFYTLQLRNEYADIRQRIEGNDVADVMLKNFGAQFKDAIFDHNTRFVQFSPTASAQDSPTAGGAKPFAGRAVLLLDPDTKKAQFFTTDLPTIDGDYELVARDESGHTTTIIIAIRATDSGISPQKITDLEPAACTNLAIRRLGEEKFVLESVGM